MVDEVFIGVSNTEVVDIGLLTLSETLPAFADVRSGVSTGLLGVVVIEEVDDGGHDDLEGRFNPGRDGSRAIQREAKKFWCVHLVRVCAFETMEDI